MCLVAKSCLTLCDPVGCSSPGSSVHGDSPGCWSGLPCPPPGDLPNRGLEPRSPALKSFPHYQMMGCVSGRGFLVHLGWEQSHRKLIIGVLYE